MYRIYLPDRFTGYPIPGSGRGKALKVPTINIALEDIPSTLEQGIYAAYAIIDGRRFPTAIHYGPRPVFQDTDAFEIHLLDTTVDHVPETLDIEMIVRLRDVQNFPSTEALYEQIDKDIEAARAILASE